MKFFQFITDLFRSMENARLELAYASEYKNDLHMEIYDLECQLGGDVPLSDIQKVEVQARLDILQIEYKNL